MANTGADLAATGVRELTTEEWHALLTFLIGESDALELSARLLLLTSPSGQEYIAQAGRYRPAFDFDRGFDLEEVVATHDAARLLERLLADAQYGTDSSYLIWKDIWRDPTVGPSPLYDLVIEIAEAREGETVEEEAREHLRLVRRAVERERDLEVYYDWRNQQGNLR